MLTVEILNNPPYFEDWISHSRAEATELSGDVTVQLPTPKDDESNTVEVTIDSGGSLLTIADWDPDTLQFTVHLDDKVKVDATETYTALITLDDGSLTHGYTFTFAVLDNTLPYFDGWDDTPIQVYEMSGNQVFQLPTPIDDDGDPVSIEVKNLQSQPLFSKV